MPGRSLVPWFPLEHPQRGSKREKLSSGCPGSAGEGQYPGERGAVGCKGSNGEHWGPVGSTPS